MAQIDKAAVYAYDQPGQGAPAYTPAAQPPYSPAAQPQPMMMTQGYPVVANQPPPTSTNTVIVQQPTTTVMVQGQRGWSSGICSCFDDMTICLCGTFCPVCYESHVATKMGENCCVPCCVPGSSIAMRAHFRGKHNIAGSIMDDCCMNVCCYQCALCQLSREIDVMARTTTVIQQGGMATTTVTNRY